MILKKTYPEIHLVQNELSKLAFIYLLSCSYSIYSTDIYLFLVRFVSNSIISAFDHVSLVC